VRLQQGAPVSVMGSWLVPGSYAAYSPAS